MPYPDLGKENGARRGNVNGRSQDNAQNRRQNTAHNPSAEIHKALKENLARTGKPHGCGQYRIAAEPLHPLAPHTVKHCVQLLMDGQPHLQALPDKRLRQAGIFIHIDHHAVNPAVLYIVQDFLPCADHFNPRNLLSHQVVPVKENHAINIELVICIMKNGVQYL